MASELGTGGLLIFAVIVGSGFVAGVQAGRALRRARQQHNRSRESSKKSARWLARREPLELYAAAVLASLTGWLMAAMFASVAYYWTLYLVLGLAISLREITRREIGGSAGIPSASAGRRRRDDQRHHRHSRPRFASRSTLDALWRQQLARVSRRNSGGRQRIGRPHTRSRGRRRRGNRECRHLSHGSPDRASPTH